MPFILRRMLETVGTQLILSLIFSSLFHFGVLEQTKGMIAMIMSLCILLNLAFLFVCLKGYFVSVDNIKYYFLVNFSVLFVLCAGAITLAALNVEPLYTFLFFSFKFLSVVFSISKIVSAIISSVFLFVYVVIAPFFM